MEPAEVKITEDEAALYDRQIRLWGLDAQKRMRASDVLVVGLTGLTGEVIKNIVLAGINSLTILETLTVSESHLSASFFVYESHLNKNVAEAAIDQIKQLNPLVKITADLSEVSTKDESYFKKFQIVCMDSGDISELIRVNDICHDNNIRYLCGSVFGFYGYTFLDLVKHEYSEEVQVPKKESEASNEGPTDTKQRRMSEPPNQKQEMESITVKKTSEFITLRESLQYNMHDLAKRKRRQLHPSYLPIRTVLDFCEKNGRKPTKSDIEDLTIQSDITNKQMCTQDLMFPTASLPVMCGYEHSATCSIVGGIFAQEILKALSQKDEPINNMFLFDPMSGAGKITQLKPAQKVKQVESVMKQQEAVEEIVL